jgi:hypothetical protein
VYAYLVSNTEVALSHRNMRTPEFWDFVIQITRPALLAAPKSFLSDIRAQMIKSGVAAAVSIHDSSVIFDFLARAIQFQGISDSVAAGYVLKHGSVHWHEISFALAGPPSCPLLRSYWNFSNCGYKKIAQSCSHPLDLRCCPLPKVPLRKGGLNQSAFHLFLFIRDVCGGDFVHWLDAQLAGAFSEFGNQRVQDITKALIGPLSNIYGISDKVMSMALSDVLVGADADRKQWVDTGAAMIVIDSLMHNFLHRTGVLRRARAEHRYGPLCYASGGCADIIQGLSTRIDARAYNMGFPAFFPRFVQHAVWRFCAQDEMNVCNGNRINDRGRCENLHCPNFEPCDRIALRL